MRTGAARSALGALQTVRALVRVKIATIGFVGMAILAPQDPDIAGGIIVALPASALQENLAKGILLADLDCVW